MNSIFRNDLQITNFLRLAFGSQNFTLNIFPPITEIQKFTDNSKNLFKYF